MPDPTKIIARGSDAMTLLLLMRGELSNYGYDVSDVKLEYEGTWGEVDMLIEVKTNGGG